MINQEERVLKELLFEIYSAGYIDGHDHLVDIKTGYEKWFESMKNIHKSNLETNERVDMKNDWIPVKQALPQKTCQVLVTVKGWVEAQRCVYHADYGVFDGAGFNSNEVLAWMPWPNKWVQSKE